MNSNSLQLKLKNGTTTNKIIKYTLFAMIFLYPLISSFLGVDMGDTGMHYFFFQNLFKFPDKIGFTTYFTSLVGWIWMRFFGFLGLWAPNFLEVVMEWGMSLLVYVNFKDHFGKITTLIGIMLASLYTGCYINIFNYHQFTVFLILVIMCCIFQVCINNKGVIYSGIAGFFWMCSFFARTTSITVIVCLLLYVFWWYVSGRPKGFLWKHITAWFAGAFISGAIITIIIFSFGHAGYYKEMLFKLSNMAGDSGSSYEMGGLLESFVFGNLKTMSSGVLTLFGGGLITAAFIKLFDKEKNKIFNIFIFLITAFVGVYLCYFAYYVIPVNGSPQLTTGPNYLAGILYTTAFIVVIASLLFKNIDNKFSLIALMAAFLPLLVVVGSSTVTKHVILAGWIGLPLITFVIKKIYLNTENICSAFTGSNYIKNFDANTDFKKSIKLSTSVVMIIMLLFTLNTAARMNNFDALNRFELTERIDSPTTRYVFTTKRQADAVNEVIWSVKDIEKAGRTSKQLMFGQAVLLNSILEIDPYITPWVTAESYNSKYFKEDLEKARAESDELPIVIYCRTNQYFGYKAFNYKRLLKSENSNLSGGRKQVLVEFLKSNNYHIAMVNDYYKIFVPYETEFQKVNTINDLK